MKTNLDHPILRHVRERVPPVAMAKAIAEATRQPRSDVPPGLMAPASA